MPADAKVYLTMNTLPTNEEADRLPESIRAAAAAGVDAFIVADLGVLDACKTYAPQIDVHLSTQVGITNYAAATAAYKMGAKRVVLARELSLQDIAIIRDKTRRSWSWKLLCMAQCASASPAAACLHLPYRTGLQPGTVRPALPLEVLSP